ncbi:MAG: diguanylate cyclase, partial [Ectothiorhodospiraceae bacterium]
MQKRTWLLVVLAPALAALVGGVGWCLAGGATASLVSGVAAYAVLAAAISWWLPGDGRSARAEGSGEVPAPSGTYTKPDGPPLQEIIDALPEGVAYFDADDRLVLCNERYRSFYSAAADMLVPGVSFESVVRACQKRGVYAGVTNDDADFLATRIMLHRKADFSHEQRLASGRWIQVQERPSSNGGTLGVWMDITEFKQREERLRRAALILEQVAEAVFVVDRDFVIRDCNPAGDRLLGVEHGQLIGASLADFFRAGERELLTHTIHAAIAHHARWDGELHFAREADEIITESVLVPLVENHGVSESLICVSRDVSERRAAEAQLDYVANYDPLTTLPNRLLFRDRLDQAMAGAAWNRQRLALMHIDLDGFQLINEGMGHDVGDRVLKMVADRLTGATRQGDTLARTGGDKYALIQTELPRVEQAAFRARHILDLLEPPLHLDGRELSI